MLAILLLVLQLGLEVTATTDFKECLNKLQSGAFGSAGLEGAVDANGNNVADVSQAVRLTYQACKALCGSSPEAFNGPHFIAQVAAWLLPWLALISQLPYGASDALKNFETTLLTVGSPMLAAFSLALAVTSNRWMVERFERSKKHSNSFLAAKVMSSLQQFSISLPKEEHVLPSLITLRENDEWWRKLAHGLDYSKSRWTLAAIMSMVYVALAYILTWVNTLRGGSDYQAYPTGQILGSLWLALLAIVVCNLQLSPKSDFDRTSAALDGANESFFLAAEKGEPAQCHGSQTITIRTTQRDPVDEDRICPTPIFFYARFYTWFQAALKISNAFDAASQRASEDGVAPRTRSKVIEYCTTYGDEDDTYIYDLINIYLKSALLAIFLQWGTTGAAVMAMYLTPTRGLGCLSGSHLLYAVLATVIWLFAAMSSVLAHNFATSPRKTRLRKVTGGLSVALRQTAKALAALNTVWIFTSTLFQFSNVESCCYCRTVALSLGRKAYGALVTTAEQMEVAKSYWAGGITMASGTALVFVIAINILMKQP